MKIVTLFKAATIYLLASTPSFADSQTTLKFSSFLPATTVSNSVSVPNFIQRVEESSGNTLKVKFYPGGSLVSGGKVQMKIVKDGVADIAEVPIPYTPGRVDGIEVFELPNLANTNLDGSLTTLKMIDEGLIKGLEDFVVLGVLQAGPYLIHTKDKVESLRDLRGLKLRVSGKTQAQIVSRLGALPVSNIPATGIAENVSRGLIDGALIDTGNLYNFGVGNLLHHHVTNLRLGSFPVLWLMSKARYNTLPEDARSAIDASGGLWFTTELGTNMNKQTDSVLARLKASGDHHFVEFSEKDLKRASNILDRVVKDYTKQSPSHEQWFEAAQSNIQ